MILKSVIRVNMHIKELMMQTHCIADVERDAGMKSTDLISRRAAIDAVNVGNLHPGIISSLKSIIEEIPSAEPWDIVKMILKELEQKEERLYSDYCDATARLNAINKIAGSDQTPNRKIDGIKPLAEMEVTE